MPIHNRSIPFLQVTIPGLDTIYKQFTDASYICPHTCVWYVIRSPVFRFCKLNKHQNNLTHPVCSLSTIPEHYYCTCFSHLLHLSTSDCSFLSATSVVFVRDTICQRQSRALGRNHNGANKLKTPSMFRCQNQILMIKAIRIAEAWRYMH